ncbi:MAG: putative toxin-antitoxin system toxin component, PIN family [Leptolyngbyaceae cyanobacterium SM1_4_3]|nr:putative toxin-antitoxin system toxin component, PIN family [Leptolyngbyaceae cyanobacterium SM1_4_3]NJN90093.1 putative toxin-antitoxin system toxin component, PIN family [Leptolyngbyaceae cyanobacterium SL_5_14]
MRVVLDVNVWISGLLWGGTPGQVLRLVQTQQITIFASEELFLELETTLQRSKFQQQLQKRGHTVSYFMTVARQLSELCSIMPIEVSELRDFEDQKILATAIAANAEVIVTGDQDLLVLEEFQNVTILSPKAFIHRCFSKFER